MATTSKKTHPRVSATKMDKPRDAMIRHAKKHSRGHRSKSKGQ